MTSRATITDLDKIAHELVEQARAHHSRRAAATLVSGPSMRATVIGLAEGAELAEHDAPPADSLQVLSGTVRLHSLGVDWMLEPGQLMAIPPARHSLTAIKDAAVLLTVTLA